MQNKLSSVDYDYFDVSCDGDTELPIDIEYSLPDYCPDIKKILKCNHSIDLTAYSFTQDRMMCEGKLNLIIEYLDENSENIRVCEITKEFSHSKEIRERENKAVGRLKASAGHIVCRAVSARKLDIHLPIILTTTLVSHSMTVINCDAHELEKKTEKIEFSSAINCVNHIFTVEEGLNLSQSLAPIDCILRKDISVDMTRCMTQDDKIIIDGIANICLVYRSFSENSSIEKASFSVNFSQAIELSPIENNLICVSDIDVCEFMISPKEDESGEFTICDLYLKLSAFVSIYKNQQEEIITDAYSTKFKCDMEYQDVFLSKFTQEYKEKLAYSKSIFLSDDELEKLIDCWCENATVTTYPEKNKLTYRGKFNICMIFKGKSKSIFSVTKTFDFSIMREFQDFAQRKSDASIKMSIKDFRIIDGNNIEFNCEGILTSQDYEIYSKRMLVQSDISSENIISKNSVKVYYSQKDESLWDIGKRYNVPVKSIIENNKLTDEFTSDGTALVIF